MHIAIDVREACRNKPTGKGVWVRGCVSALLRSKDHTFTLLSDAVLPEEWLLPNVHAERLHSGIRWHVDAARLLRRAQPDVYLSTTSFLLPALLFGVPIVSVVHDLIAFRREPHDKKAVLLERLFLPLALRRSTHICCVSESTKSDLLQRFGFLQKKNLATVYAGPLHTVFPTRVANPVGILCIATLCPRKNQRRLIQAYAGLPERIRSSHPLLLAGGRGWHDEDIVREVRQTPGVQWLEYVSDQQYSELLSSCAVFAYPSLYEGFGLPVLDALQRGIPVLTSAEGSLQEVAGDAAMLIDPLSVSSIREGLLSLLTSIDERRKLEQAGPRQAAQFSWDRTAGIVLDVLSHL